MAREDRADGPHPRKVPLFDRPLSRQALAEVFADRGDYMERTVYLNGDRERPVTVCYLLGGVNLFLGGVNMTQGFSFAWVNVALGAAVCLGALPLALRRHKLAQKRKMQE